MPQHKSAEKRTRQNETRRMRNVQKRSKMKNAIKKVQNAPDKESAAVELKKTASLLDRMAVKGIIHKNKAANIKSKLTRMVNSIQ
ncbi:30S ribosomal protein S20 [bacterium]|nr:30S ribosomal protein S20 [bacterium]